MSKPDLAVIGAGSAGLVAATTAARLGARVVLIESDRVGGDCTWTGCVPSKALIHAARAAHQARTIAWTDGSGSDYAAAAGHVRNAVEAVYSHETPELLASLGIEVVKGAAEFRDRTAVEVGGRVVAARRFILCTGAAPAIPPIEGLANVDYLTYQTIFGLEKLPERLIVLGGGPVGAELAQALGRLGSQVTLFEAGPRLLPIADPEASAVIDSVFRREGIDVQLGQTVERVQALPDGVAVFAGGRRVTANAILVATGRIPTTTPLRLDRAGIALNGEAIRVDSRLRTTTPGIFAAGDVTGGMQFTHYAGWQGFAAARNALFPGSVKGLRQGVPWTVFTEPAVGQAGITLDAARRADPEAFERRINLDHVDRAQTDAATTGFLKFVVGRNGKLLGATVVSPSAGELLNELSVAIEAGATVGSLARSIHVYPTYGFAIQDLASRIASERAASGWRGRLLARMARH